MNTLTRMDAVNPFIGRRVAYVTVYKTLSGRWSFRHESGRSANGSWASKAYTMKVIKDCGFVAK